jgi:hypothetical protein
MENVFKRIQNNKLVFGFTVLIIILFFINRYMYLNRANGFLYTDAVNYNQFYYIDKDYRIVGFENMAGDSLRLKILPEPKKFDWNIKSSDHNYTLRATSLPKIKLIPGTNSYEISSHGTDGLDSISLTIEFLKKDNSVMIENSSLPIIEYDLFPMEKWTKIPDKISQNEIDEVKKILKEEVKITGQEETVEKISRIGRYLIQQLKPHEGKSLSEFKLLTPLEQFKRARAKKNKVDCANYSDIYFLFANCAGIPTRRIGVAGTIDHVTTSGHVFNESYVREQQKWAFVDLMSKKLMVLNGKNAVLNTVDLLNINRMKVYGKTRTITVDSLNKIDSVGYKLTNYSEVEYLKPTVSIYSINANINDNMGFIDTFKEYLGTSSHYGTYYINTIMIDNSKHYIKLHVFEASAALFFFWLLLIILKIFIKQF